MKIGILGLWHLGCTLAVSWSELHNEVIGFDYNIDIVNNLKKGIPPIFEPNLEHGIKNYLNQGLTFTDNIKDFLDCDYVFITYDTPVDDNDNSDTTILENSVKDISKILKNNSVVIITSQSPVGFCSRMRNILQSQNPTLELAYSPENLRLGDAIRCYLQPERIIIGTSNKKTEEKCLNLFYQIQSRNYINNIPSTDFICMNLESAEMVKHGINSFLATSITFANQLSDLCSETGANIDDVIKGMKSDERIGKKAYLSPGIGFSGGTLGRDLKVLSKINNNIKKAGFWKPATLFEKIYNLNENRKNIIISKIKFIFGDFKDKNIGVLGLTYKPGTSTLRRSIPLDIVNIMINEGANVKIFDPKADYNELSEINFEICNSIEDVSSNIDFLVLLTEWQDFKNYNWNNIDINIFDTKNFLKLNKTNYFTI